MNGYSFTRTGWYAVFDPAVSKGRIIQTPIEAWAPDGSALVVDSAAGALVSASAQPGFKGLQPCDAVHSTLPAQPGWTARLTEKDGSESYVVDVVGWVVTVDGEAEPLLASSDSASTPRGWSDGEIMMLLPPGRDI